MAAEPTVVFDSPLDVSFCSSMRLLNHAQPPLYAGKRGVQAFCASCAADTAAGGTHSAHHRQAIMLLLTHDCIPAREIADSTAPLSVVTSVKFKRQLGG